MWDGENFTKIYDFEDIDTYSAQPNLLDITGQAIWGQISKCIELFNIPELFDNPKPIELLKHLISISNKQKEEIILELLCWLCYHYPAVMQLNAEDGSNRKFIMVQLPEGIDQSEAARLAIQYMQKYQRTHPPRSKNS